MLVYACLALFTATRSASDKAYVSVVSNSIPSVTYSFPYRTFSTRRCSLSAFGNFVITLLLCLCYCRRYYIPRHPKSCAPSTSDCYFAVVAVRICDLRVNCYLTTPSPKPLPSNTALTTPEPGRHHPRRVCWYRQGGGHQPDTIAGPI